MKSYSDNYLVFATVLIAFGETKILTSALQQLHFSFCVKDASEGKEKKLIRL